LVFTKYQNKFREWDFSSQTSDSLHLVLLFKKFLTHNSGGRGQEDHGLNSTGSNSSWYFMSKIFNKTGQQG
jgi:hypothetical protein